MGGLPLYHDGGDASDSDGMYTANGTADTMPANGTLTGGCSAATSSSNLAARHHEEDDKDEDEDVEALLKQWKRKFPSKSKVKPVSLGFDGLATFLSGALTLVDAGEEHMETVILALASEGGRTRLDDLISRDFSSFNDDVLIRVWNRLLLVYFKVLSHDAVLQSEAIDHRHGVLMTELYGEDGERGSSVFTAAVRGLLLDIKQGVEAGIVQENVEVCIAILSCMLAQSSSTVTMELRAAAESMVSLLGTPHRRKNTDSRVQSIRALLNQSLSAQRGDAAPPAVEAPLPQAPVSPPALPPAVTSTPRAAVPALRQPPLATFTIRKATKKTQGTTGIRRLKAATTAALGATQDVTGGLTASTAVSPAPLVVAETLAGGRPTFSRHNNDKEHIANIEILPTWEEIVSNKTAYLPREDPSTWHKSGMPGVIDRHFRLVREDTVGQLRDAVKVQLEALRNPNPTPKPASTHYAASDQNQGARTNVYRGVALEGVEFDERKGLQFILTINQQPTSRSVHTRENWWKQEQRLGPDSVICLLSANGGVHFLTVHNPPPLKPGKKPNPNAVHKRYTLGMRPERAFVIAELASTNPDDATALLKTLADKSAKASGCLIEFPGQILPSFIPTLAALQTMSKSSHNIPFADALTPDFKNFEPSPPLYSRSRGFQYQLQALLSEDEQIRFARTQGSGRPQSMESILKRSVLDDVQQDAVKHALTNELALIQGPPGTGKSFTGVKLIEALLENRNAADLGPIICVCYTNHALDQLLEHLMDAGVENIIRMGSKSKSERLAESNIRVVASRLQFEGGEGAQMGRARKCIKKAERNIEALVDRWQKVLTHQDAEDAEVTTILARDFPALHAQLPVGNSVRGRILLTPIQQWLQGTLGSESSDANAGSRRRMSAMSDAERKGFHQELLASIFEDLYKELVFELQSFYDRRSIIDSVLGALDLRALSSADVIGVTTSGLAGKYKRLRKLRSKVVIVEEAGEVLEAHLLTAMLPSVEHAVLIGDHQQLRPKVNNYDLSIDNPCSRITLDVSLFERLVSPRFDRSPGLPFVTLEKQRRMHPSVSHLIRSLYPRLGDADNVKSYPPVAGMAKRLFWLDHRNKEDDTRNTPSSVSQSNAWEVGMVAALVGHLQKQGVYSAGDIAVLTPYSGQLKALQKQLGPSFGIMLSERDIEDGIQADGSRGRLLPIRISTVDAFQGEEAKVIIISMVRSNDKKICGFLESTNRINVLLSRAMHGMYIIGNSYTTSEVTMWQNVVNMFKAGGNFGPALEIACERHPQSQAPVLVRESRDFSRVSPEAGCNAECGKELLCGHTCTEKCHSDAMHRRVKCKQQCNLPMKGCEHLCEKPCGEGCEPNCKSMIPCDLSLPCGHHLTEMHCFQQHQKLSNIRCRVQVEHDMPGCGHKTKSECYISVDHPKFHCKEACAAELPCDHSCGRNCADCSVRDKANTITKVDHGSCVEQCGRAFSNCNHKCSKPCHGSETACPPCNAPCQSDCSHQKCIKRCGEPCSPCTKEKCSSVCTHSGCSMPCAAPCDLIPCFKRCTEKLKCGHLCPSVCGETCPAVEFCRRCANDAIKSKVVDPITGLVYEDVDEPCMFLPCGHIFTVGALDRHMDMAAYYEMDDYGETTIAVAPIGDLPPLTFDKPKSCPTCRGSLRTISRYGRIVRRALLDEKTLKFIASSNHSYAILAQQLDGYKQSLSGTIDKGRLSSDIALGTEAVVPTIKGREGNPYQSVSKSTGNRYLSTINLRLNIRSLQQKIEEEELPFRKVRDMVEAAGLRKDPEFNLDQHILRTDTTLLALQALLIRCDLVISTDLVSLWKSKSGTKLSVNFKKNRDACDALLDDATKNRDILQQAEAHIFWAQFLLLECAVRSHEVEQANKIRAKESEALARLVKATELCEEFPEETKDVESEVAGAREMFK